MHPFLTKVCAPVFAYHEFVLGIIRGIDEMHAQGDFSAAGQDFMIHMASMYWGIRGFMDMTVTQAMMPLLDKMGVDSAVGQAISSRCRLPWSMKSLFAVVSDILPVAHYKKLRYMLLTTSLGTLALLFLGLLSYESLGGRKAGLAFILLVLVNTMGASDDCLTQGKYTQVAKGKGSAIVSFQYSAMNAAAIIVSLIIGYLNDTAGPQWAILLCMPFAAQAVPVIFMNFMGDEKQPAFCQPDTTVLKDNWKVIVLGVSMGCVALGLMIIPQLPWPPAMEPNIVNILFGLLATGGLLGLTFWSLPHQVAKITVYLFLCRTMTLSVQYPLYQYYTASEAQCPGAPHFPNLIFQSVGGTMGSLAVLGGTALFQMYVVHWNARKAFWVTTAFTCLGAVFDLGLTTGWNRNVLGWTGLGSVTIGPLSNWSDPVRLDDLMSFLFGTSMLLPLAETLDGLPSTLLLSKLCPKNVESTVFAILAGFMNIGMSLSGLLGSEFIKLFGFDISIDRTADGETFNCELGGSESMNGLAWSVVIGTMVLPSITIPLTFFFIPDIRLDEDFLPPAREVEMVEAAAADGNAAIAGSGLQAECAEAPPVGSDATSGLVRESSTRSTASTPRGPSSRSFLLDIAIPLQQSNSGGRLGMI